VTDQSEQPLLVEELAWALEPLVRALDSDAELRNLFASAGWDVDAVGDVPIDDLARALASSRAAFDVVVDISERGLPTLSDTKEVLRSADALAKAIGSASAVVARGAQLPHGFERVGAELVELLFLLYLARRHRLVFDLCVLLTLIDAPSVGGDDGGENVSDTAARLAVARPHVRLDRIPMLVRDPQAFLGATYAPSGGLATAASTKELSDRLFPRLAAVLRTLGLSAVYGTSAAARVDFGSSAANELTASMLTVLYRLDLGPELAGSSVGASFYLSPRDSGDLGLVIVPRGDLAFANDVAGWRVEVAVGAAFSAIAVGGGDGLLVEGGPPSVEVSLEATKLPSDGAAFRIGSAAGTRLELGELVLRAHAGLEPARFELALEAEATSGALVVAAGDGDGFLQRILPAEGLRAEFELGVGWSSRKGLHFRGAAALEATLPVQTDLLGILRIESVYLSLRAQESGLAAAVAATATVTLGPVSATVERVGLEATLDTATDAGNLGPAGLALDFKPPAGAALRVDAAIAVGGGYLFFDREAEQYAGVVQLELGGKVSLKAIGLLTTRMPDGRPGFSLLLVITAEGFGAVPLGLGFSLTGVGGLIGVNRSMNVAALRAGIRTGALDSLLFPSDPVRNAAAIVSTLNALVPPAPQRYLIGPMAVIEWGTPTTILTLKLALVLELPSPVRLAVLGRLTAMLPNAKNPLVRIQMDAFGLVDFDQGELSLDATLFDSRLLEFPLTGDMALRVRWGADPTFVLAVGGCNPRFQAPAGFPALERVAISLAQREDLRVRLAAYVALTSNSVQLGARLDLYAAAGGFSVEGALGFDALFQFDPFRLAVDLAASVALKYDKTVLFAVYLEGELTGPSPWRLRGRAGFELIGIKLEIAVDASFGPAIPSPRPEPVDVGRLLREALAAPGSWSAELPADERPLVSLRETPGAGLLAHPLATVAVRQRVVPLGTRIERFGTTVPRGEARFDVRPARKDGKPLPLEPLLDAFAPAQFRALTDDQKLTSPAFEPMQAGFRVSPSRPEDPRELRLVDDVRYETITIDPAAAAETDGGAPYRIREEVLARLVAIGAPDLRRSGTDRYRVQQGASPKEAVKS
jgi:hypothetical protein